jgi:hypothetical protein
MVCGGQIERRGNNRVSVSSLRSAPPGAGRAHARLLNAPGKPLAAKWQRHQLRVRGTLCCCRSAPYLSRVRGGLSRWHQKNGDLWRIMLCRRVRTYQAYRKSCHDMNARGFGCVSLSRLWTYGRVFLSWQIGSTRPRRGRRRHLSRGCVFAHRCICFFAHSAYPETRWRCQLSRNARNTTPHAQQHTDNSRVINALHERAASSSCASN